MFAPLKELSKFFIIMAMAAIGLNTNIVKLVKTGGKPILMGMACWIGITLVSLGMQLWCRGSGKNLVRNVKRDRVFSIWDVVFLKIPRPQLFYTVVNRSRTWPVITGGASHSR